MVTTAAVPSFLRASSDGRRWTADAVTCARYEAEGDADVCLHLPVEDCDHAVFRCLTCCRHADDAGAV